MLFQVAKGLEGNPKVANKIMMKTCLCCVLKFYRRNNLLLKKNIGMLGDPTQVAAPATPTKQARKEKYTELIQYFPQK